MSKGSGRRPQQVPQETVNSNWDKIFNSQPKRELDNGANKSTSKQSHPPRRT